MSVETEYLDSLQKIVVAFEEIAASRMQKVRQGVVKNRQFAEELNQVFGIVKTSYDEEIERKKLVIDRGKNKQTARVFISANSGLYGDLIQRVFRQFKTDLQKSGGEVVIIGLLGKNLAESLGLGRPFLYFDFPDTEFDRQVAQTLVEKLVVYEKVIVYHGYFKNILMQQTVATDVTGNVLPQAPVEPKRKLLFEPNLGEILYLFETEIFSSLLVQAIFESQLAKYSARMATLDQARDKILEASRLATFKEAKERHRMMNKKQLSMLTTRLKWKK